MPLSSAPNHPIGRLRDHRLLRSDAFINGAWITGAARFAVYDPATRLLRWKTRWSGLSGAITGAQFHGPADAGQNAPAVLAWPAPFGASYEGRATLGAAQASDLLAGRWYVSVYTAAYPLGELRGQVRVVP